MQETELAHPADPFLQGDIIHLINHNEASCDPAHGIVINADCDLAHCKIDGVVSYLPLYSFDYFFQKFWIPRFIEERSHELLQSLTQICGLDRDDFGELAGWIHDDDPADVIQKLIRTYFIKEAAIKQKVLELHAITQCPEYDLNLLYRLIDIQGQKKEETVLKHAKRALRTMGDGHFFINEIAGVTSVGFVARMRRIYSIAAEFVFPSISAFRLANPTSEAVYAIRIARLSHLYRFKIAQLFAYQFSRIGLPDDLKIVSVGLSPSATSAVAAYSSHSPARSIAGNVASKSYRKSAICGV